MLVIFCACVQQVQVVAQLIGTKNWEGGVALPCGRSAGHGSGCRLAAPPAAPALLAGSRAHASRSTSCNKLLIFATPPSQFLVPISCATTCTCCTQAQNITNNGPLASPDLRHGAKFRITAATKFTSKLPKMGSRAWPAARVSDDQQMQL